MIEGLLEQMAHREFPSHRRHDMLRNLRDRRVFVAESAGKSGTRIDIDDAPVMLSVTTQTAEVVQSGQREMRARQQTCPFF